jgi:NTP pyrophosphatase (non-canonical NTP hydrolase)
VRSVSFVRKIVGILGVPLIRRRKMTNKQYAKFVKEYFFGDAKHNIPEEDITHAVLGLVGEAGEVVEVYKKGRYYKDKSLDELSLATELGDVLFYVTAIANETGYSLEDLMTINTNKLRKRYGK